MKTSSPGKAKFDAVAENYDARFTRQPIARHLRADVMRRVLSLLAPTGEPVLEIGCGTGEDACTFAEQGFDVLATDASLEMLRHAAVKAGSPPAYETALWRVGQAVPEAVGAAAPFELVFSNFGAVNCIKDLAGFGRDCERLMTPGGHVALVLINRWCLMEVLLGAIRLDRRSMTRRFRKHRKARLEDGTMLDVQFPSCRALSVEMGPAFSLVTCQPVGVFLPPSEYYEAFQKRPRLLQFAMWLDKHLGPLWPLSRLGDHMLVVLRYEERRQPVKGQMEHPV